LADRVAVKISKEKGILGQVPAICEAIWKSKNDVFVPEYVDAMLRLAKRDHVWLEVTSNSIESILQRCVVSQTKELNIDEFLDLSKLICRLIDFKSEFTATHSTGVAAAAVAIAKRVGFSDEEQKLMEIAANLHDLGKIAIPSEILEKPGRLSDQESFVMRAHVYYTYEILKPIDIMGVTSAWGALHQERLDGSGYPFGYTSEEIPLGSKIMGVADVFTALTEGRPYRGGMDKTRTISILRSMSDSGKLDPGLVKIVTENFDEMNRIRKTAQDQASKKYREFRSEMSRKVA
jgi:HD-GYP domain-containing protein (c-di-GMP phosphodiesterase class II)